MTPAAERADLIEVTRTVRRLIGTAWADDIIVVSSGFADGDDDQNGGTPYVDLGATSDIACYQAMISIADHATNRIEDWEDGWVQHAGADGGPRYTLRVWDPVVQARELA